MNKTRWTAVAAGLVIAGTSAATVISLESAASAAGSVTVKTRTVSPYGKILTTNTGRTLYVFSEDPKGKSACTGTCAAVWPPLTVPKGQHVSGVSGLGTIKRSDGKLQVALNGHALYRYSGDTAAGQVKGQKVDGDWFVETTSGPSHLTPSTPKPTPTATKSSPPSGGGYGY
jgi:predicted lipoprotein with Yx(FWY)xxD motif